MIKDKAVICKACGQRFNYETDYEHSKYNQECVHCGCVIWEA